MELNLSVKDILFDIRRYRERNELAHANVNEFAKQKDWHCLAP